MIESYLIIGGSSAIGKEFKKQLNKKGAIVKSIEIRITQDQILLEIKSFKPNYIINCIGVIDGGFKYCLDINFLISKNILDFIYEYKFKTKILLIGSAAEYGLVKPNDNPINESYEAKPLTDYGITKYWQTILAQRYAEQGVNVVIGRVFNIESEEISTKLFLGLLCSQIKKLKAGEIKKIKIGAVESYRDYIAIEEAVNKLINILEHGQSGQVYNIGTGVPISMNKLLNKYLLKYDVSKEKIDIDEKIRTNNNEIIYSDNTKYNNLFKKSDIK
jgi:GDP-4-dehydro-6-deoxy-D-mannose reductase